MAECDFCLYIGQYYQRNKKLTYNILTCAYWEGTLSLEGAGCDFFLYIGQYYQRNKKLTYNILTCAYWEGTLSLEVAGCYFCIFIGQHNQRSTKLTKNILTSGYWEGTLVLYGALVIYVSILDNIINELRSLQTIHSHVVIGRGIPSLTGGV